MLIMVFSATSLISCSKDKEAEPITYTVTFNSNGGSHVDNVIIESGNKVSKPNNPTKAGFVFSDWYKDSGLLSKWNFASDVIKGNIDLYAKWIGFNAVVTITEVKNIDYNKSDVLFTVSLNGESTAITEKGICYSSKAQPTVNDLKIVAGNNETMLTISSLNANNPYHVRGYATDGVTVIYSDELSFKTLDHPLNTTMYELNIPITGNYNIFIADENEKQKNGIADILLSNQTYGTNDLLGMLNNGGDAITHCKAKGERWYLPSQQELYYLMEKLENINKPLPSGRYWTSTQVNSTFAWAMDVGMGGIGISKSSQCIIRCVWR